MAKTRETRHGCAPVLRTAFRRTGPSTFSGFAVDPADLARKFTVELIVDGIPVRTQRAVVGARGVLMTWWGAGGLGLFDVTGGRNFLASLDARRCFACRGGSIVRALRLCQGLCDEPHQLIDAQREDAEHQVAEHLGVAAHP
jgi:hypothetical protein